MLRAVGTRRVFAQDAMFTLAFATGVRGSRFEKRRMTDNADVILFTYSLVLVGLATGAQMLYYGALLRRPMTLGGAPIAPRQLLSAGAVFAIAGVLATAVMAAEILSGAAGTDLRSFILATVVIPLAVICYHAWRNRARSA